MITFCYLSWIVFFAVGLCGNFNGNPRDDFKHPTSGKILKNPNEFGNLFQTDTKPRFANMVEFLCFYFAQLQLLFYEDFLNCFFFSTSAGLPLEFENGNFGF